MTPAHASGPTPPARPERPRHVAAARSWGTVLFAALALALAGCGDTLVDHRNTAIQDTGGGGLTCPDETAVVCGSECLPQNENRCGSTCQPCAAPLQGQTVSCTPTGNHEGRCDYTCEPGLLVCATGCCAPALVASGGEFSCAATSPADGGRVHCWGAGDQGQLGGAADRHTSSLIPGLTGVTVLAAGDAHACASDGARTLCWGNGAGFGVAATVPTPTEVTALANATALAAGTAHTCAIVAGGVKCVGAGTSGGGNPGLTTGVTDIAAGAAFTCVVQSGVVKCWGDGTSGQLGTGTSTAATATPLTVTRPGTVTGTIQHVSAGARHGCASTDAADLPLFCWGDNASKQLGTDPGTLLGPTQNARVKKPVSALSAGGVVSCAVEHDLNPNGSLECWSADDIAAGGGAGSGEPFILLSGVTPGPFSTGGTHTCLIEAAVAPNRLRCFGHGLRGQLGDGNASDSQAPVLVVDR